MHGSRERRCLVINSSPRAQEVNTRSLASSAQIPPLPTRCPEHQQWEASSLNLVAGWTQLARQLCLGPLESQLFLRGCHLKELVFILWCLPGRPGHFDNHCAAIQRAILRFFFFFFFPNQGRPGPNFYQSFTLGRKVTQLIGFKVTVALQAIAGGRWGLSPTCLLCKVLCLTLWTHLQNHLFLRTQACPPHLRLWFLLPEVNFCTGLFQGATWL